MYVGSHTWDGSEGAVDEEYHGSSVIACKYGWVPVETSILEVVSEERKYVSEREWILKYCNEFGGASNSKEITSGFWIAV